MKPSINIITLGVKDLARATAFHEKGLGFPKMDFEGDISFLDDHLWEVAYNPFFWPGPKN